MGTWVKVASAPLAAGLTNRFRAGRAWPPGDLDAQTPVFVDDDVLKELKADEMLRVEKVSAPPNGDESQMLRLPQRMAVDPQAAAVERLERAKRENEALKAHDEATQLEAENDRIRAKQEGKAAPARRADETTAKHERK